MVCKFTIHCMNSSSTKQQKNHIEILITHIHSPLTKMIELKKKSKQQKNHIEILITHIHYSPLTKIEFKKKQKS